MRFDDPIVYTLDIYTANKWMNLYLDYMSPTDKDNKFLQVLKHRFQLDKSYIHYLRPITDDFFQHRMLGRKKVELTDLTMADLKGTLMEPVLKMD